MRMKLWFMLLVFLLFFIIISSSCFWRKAKYDPEGHGYAVSLQSRALLLIDKASAGKSFSQYQTDVQNLMTDVEKAYEHALTQSKNDSIAGIWDTLRDPMANRLGFFMQKWETEDILVDSLYATFIKEARDAIQKDFTLITTLEDGKKK